jgi:hypothetical protein
MLLRSVRKTWHPSCYLLKHVSSSLTTGILSAPLCVLIRTSTSAAWSVSAPVCLNGLVLAVCKQTYTYSYRYIQQHRILSITATASLIPLSVYKTVTIPCQTTQQNLTFLGLVAAILNCGHTSQQVVHVYTAYNLYSVTSQPEGPKNTLTNCTCTPCFYTTAACHKFLLRDSNSGRQTNPILCSVT